MKLLYKKIIIGLIALLGNMTVHASTETIEIGVLAKRGADTTHQRWAKLAQYLDKKVPEFHFSIIPLSFADIEQAIKEHQIDFLLTNSGMFSDFSFSYQLSPVATLKRRILGNSFTQFGSVVFTHKDRLDISSYKMLGGHKLAAVSKQSFGGWVAAYREIDSVGLSVNSFSSLDFLGTHDEVVYAVRDGKADAGIVRTDTLETMASEGKIKLSDFKAIPVPLNSVSSNQSSYPLLLSSRLYPEWPLAKLPHVPDLVAEKVVSALLILDENSDAAKSASIMGWTIPQNYREVDMAYSQLGLGAYKKLVNYSFIDVIVRYWKYVLLIFFAITTLAATVIYILSLNKNLKRTQEKLETLANTDGLTGLPNRIFFMKLAEKYMKIAKREKRNAAIMFLDLDRFKPINDTYGHDVGDDILITIAKRIQDTLRLSDIVARIGGDEFLVMLWDIDSVENLEAVVNKLIKVSSAPMVTTKGDQVSVGCSVGVSLYQGGGDTLKDLIKQADVALYQVKEQGRGFFIIHQGA